VPAEPVEPGSGGAYGNGNGGSGGGVIHLTVAGTATINGDLNANASGGSGDRTGGGAGGTINLRCNILAGATGRLLATGGNGGTFVGGGGGGGLIAVRYLKNITDPDAETAWANSVAGGIGSTRTNGGGDLYPTPGDNGIITFLGPPAGTVLLFR
jgi:hypothetical protein